MKQSSVPVNKADRPVQFRQQDAQRIASAVHAVETARRDRKPSWLPRAFTGKGTGDGLLHLCKTTATFQKGTLARLPVYESCEPPNETASTNTDGSYVTIGDVVNKYATIPANRFVSIGQHGNGYWYVVSAECG